MPTCFICQSSLQSINGLEYHLSINHKLEPNARHSCKEGSCTRDFPSWRYLKRHLTRDHESDTASERINVPVSHHENNEGSEEMIETELSQQSKFEETSGCVVEPSESKSLTFVNDQIGTFMSKLYCNKKLPRSAVQDIVKDVSMLTKTVFEACSTSTREEILALSNENIFNQFRSEHCRFNYLRKSGYLFDPIGVPIGEVEKTCRRSGQVTITNVDAKVQIMPLGVMLTKFFELPDVYETVLDYVDSLKTSTNGGELENFYQGTLWTEKAASFPGKEVYPIFGYHDDIQVNNPLGSHTKNMGAVYCLFPFLPPPFRSSLENIFMFALYESIDKNSFGYSSILRPMVNELKKLRSQGVVISTKEGPKRIFFLFCLMLGDNLALNLILGFHASFNSTHYCRFCRAEKCVCQTMLREMKELLRNKVNFLSDLEKDHSESGVKENSILNELPDYHVTLNKAVDILHDFLEGVCSYDMSKILHHLVFLAKRKVSLETLNFRLRTFDYYLNDIRNEVPFIIEGHLKSQRLPRLSGSEMLTLVRILGVVIGDQVDENDPVWRLYLLLRRILDLLLAPIIQPHCSVLLQQLIAEHHATYLDLFPGETLKPKFHFAVHYPTLLQEVGPLVHLSCMRLEAKHRDATMIADSTESRRNIAYTIALRQQLIFADRLMRRHGLKPSLEMPVVSSCEISDLSDHENFSSQLPSKPVYYAPAWIDFNGTRYRIGMCVIIGSTDTSEPEFGLIQYILVDDENKVFLACKLLDIVRFNKHIHGYQVIVEDIWRCVEIENLFRSHPVIIANIASGDLVVTLKYAL